MGRVHSSASAASAAEDGVGEFIHYNENKGNLLCVSEKLFFLMLSMPLTSSEHSHKQCAALRCIELHKKVLHCRLLQENGEADAKTGEYLSVSDDNAD